MLTTGGWCPKCRIHWVDDIRLPLCPVCEDIERQNRENNRRKLGWGNR